MEQVSSIHQIEKTSSSSIKSGGSQDPRELDGYVLSPGCVLQAERIC